MKLWAVGCAACGLVLPQGALGNVEVVTLREAIDVVRNQNPAARAAHLRVERARAAVQAVNATFWPALGLSASYAATDNPAIAFSYFVNQEAIEPSLDFNDLPTVDDLNLEAAVQLPIWVGGRRFAGRTAARAATRAAEAREAAVKEDLALAVARTYFAIQKAKGFVRSAEAAVAAFEENTRIAEERFSAGTLLRQQLLDVAVRRARAREDRIRAQNAVALGLRALENLLGREAGAVRIASEEVSLVVPEVDDEAWARRPSFSAVREGVKRAEAEVQVARAGYWPRLSAFGSVLFDQGFVNDGRRLSFVAGVGLEWSAWDGLETQAQVRQALSAAGALRAQTEGRRRALRLELEQARIRFEDAHERLRVTEDEIALAQESAELSRSRFQEGLALSSELIDSETALTAAQVRRADSEAELQIAIAALRRSAGLPIIATGGRP